jgi:hypothetical protein
MRSFAAIIRFINSRGTIGMSSVNDRRSLCDRALLQRLLFLVLCCSSGLGACRHPPWFHFNISPFLPHVVPSISVYISFPFLISRCQGHNSPLTIEHYMHSYIASYFSYHHCFHKSCFPSKT